MLGNAAVAAQQAAVGIRSDDGNGLDAVERERRQVVLVLEQRDGLARRLQGQLAMGVAAHQCVGGVGIDVGVVEEPQLEFRVEHGRDQLVELALLEDAFADQFRQVQVAIRFGQLDVDAGFHRQAAGFLFILARRRGRGCRRDSSARQWHSSRRQ